MFATCHNGNKHFIYPKHYRHYFDDPYDVTCNCKGSDGKRRKWNTDTDFWKHTGEENPRTVGKTCTDCGTKYRPVKVWNLVCSECKPKEEK